MSVEWDISLRFKELDYTKDDLFIALREDGRVKIGDILKLNYDDYSYLPQYRVIFKCTDYETMIEGYLWYYPISWTRKLKVQDNEL